MGPVAQVSSRVKEISVRVQVKGYFEQESGERIAFPSIVGKWDEAMTAVLADGTSRLLWKKAAPPPDPTR